MAGAPKGRSIGSHRRTAADDLSLYLQNGDAKLADPRDLELLEPAPHTAAPTSRTRSLSNKRAFHNGRWWEDRIRQDLARIADDPHLSGKIVVIKTDPPSRVVYVKGRPTVIYEKNGPPDWMGVAYGIPVAFETKHVEAGDRFSVTMPSAKGGGNFQQWEHLERIARAAPRSLVGYYIYWGEADQRRFHPLSVFTFTKSGTPKTSRTDGLIVSDLLDLLARLCP